MSEKWKIFERIVAAIHHAETRGAKVVWNDIIKGRQFDVSVRFKYGIYDYLTVIECKDHSNPIPIELLEAFITKSSDVKANKAIMVSSSGFQSGCIDKANLHDIELYQLKEIYELSEEELSGKFTPALNIYHVQIRPIGKVRKILLPEQRNRLHYVLNNVIFDLNQHKLTLLSLIEKELLKLLPSEQEKSHRFNIEKSCKIFVPLIERQFTVKEIFFKYRIVPGAMVKGQTLDPFLLDQGNKKYSYNNVLGDNEHLYLLDDLELGFDTQMEPGKFYHNPKLDFYYYCEKVENEKAQVYVVETFQHGRCIQTSGSMDIENAKQLVEVKNKKDLIRLKKRLSKLKTENDKYTQKTSSREFGGHVT